MHLVDRYLPEHQFSETHTIVIRAPARAVLDAVSGADLSDDPFVRTLLHLRGIPARLRAAFGGPEATDTWRRFGLHRFVRLGRDGDREIAFGLVGRFWESAGGLVDMADAQAFEHFAAPGVAKLVMSYATEACGDATRLTTVTRVHCPDAASSRRFTPYWLVIRPASGFIRRRALARVKAVAERA